MRDGAQVNQMNRASNGKWEDLQAFARRSQAGGTCSGLLSQACNQGLPSLSTPRDSFVGLTSLWKLSEPCEYPVILMIKGKEAVYWEQHLIKEHVSFRKELAMGTWFFSVSGKARCLSYSILFSSSLS